MSVSQERSLEVKQAFVLIESCHDVIQQIVVCLDLMLSRCTWTGFFAFDIKIHQVFQQPLTKVLHLVFYQLFQSVIR